MAKITRRSFVGIMAASTTALSMPSIAFGALPRVVVIGEEEQVELLLQNILQKTLKER